MEGKEIKEQCELMYAQIANATAKLEELRKLCKHENTFQGNYSWRIGCIQPATICSDCGELIKLLDWPPTLEDYDRSYNEMVAADKLAEGRKNQEGDSSI